MVGDGRIQRAKERLGWGIYKKGKITYVTEVGA